MQIITKERIGRHFFTFCPFSDLERGTVAYFNKSEIWFINLTIRFLNRFCRIDGNDLGIVRNAFFCVTVLSNNPCWYKDSDFLWTCKNIRFRFYTKRRYEVMSLAPSSLLFLVTVRLVATASGNKIKGFSASYEK